MFYNVLRGTVQTHIRNVSNYNLIRLASSSGRPKDDIKDALDIEASLFDNSLLQHRPVNTREVLRKHKPNFTRKPKKEPQNVLVAEKITEMQSLTKFPNPAFTRTHAPLIKDSELNLEFTRLTLQDPLMSTLLTEVRSRKRRDKNKQIIIEGRRLIEEALECGLRMHALFFSQKDQLGLLREPVAQAQQEHNTMIYKVPQHDLKTWSALVTPPGLLALFERPSARGLLQQQQLGSEPLPITVVCDNIREPNNLGSIIRTCAALPCTQVVVTHGCCDPWESKALRGGCGGQFRLPIRDDVTWEQLALHIPPEAAEDCHVFIAENNPEKRTSQEGRTTVDYAELGKVGAHNILIIGGESHGVSEDAYRFMHLVGSRGKCVYIPLAMGIDSLNVASALTLILFELRRKLVNKDD
ncbi:rRNA methyltransferase 3, mitochondrial [Drosophila grimshawi]|uniref:GH16936 n=1 Tax=Drosophila grimshawi TaxID=7222 RepID=B4IY19_DROGR|nr:rRNA methyltransferase 3, mitochondrial [Drosophila grimshawi]EDV97562.1 GH16936 [Drosophila grimshawi]